MKHILATIAAAIALFSPASAARPNVLFIAVDDLVPALGCYGDALAQTPEIDALAAQGTTFLNHHCQFAVCGPSRAALTTSLMPEETNVMGFKPIRAVLPDVITMPQHFRNSGYETACTGKFHDYRTVGTIVDPDSSTTGGGTTDDIPSWSIAYNKDDNGAYKPAGKPAVDNADLDDSVYGDHMILSAGLGLLDTLEGGSKPFFLAVGFKKPHLAFIAPQRCWDQFDRNAFPLAAFSGLPINVSSNNSDSLTNNGELLGYEPFDTSGLPTEAEQRELIHGYYACVSFIDDLVGQLLDKLAVTDDPVQPGKKMSETTIVVLWGDHGFHLGDHGKWAKHTAMERSTSCPLIIHDPANPGGGVTTTSPANSMDLYPTLCELAGLTIPEQPLSATQITGRPLRGRSLVPVLNDPAGAVHHGAISQFNKNGAYGYSYRTERFRYIEWVNGSNTVVARDLYDYRTDPHETRNVVDDPEYAAVAYQLSRSMRAETTTRGAVRLQSAAPAATGGETTLPGLEIGREGADDVLLTWPGSGGVTYDVLSNPDLTPGGWSEFLTDIAGDRVSFPATLPRNFFLVGIGDNTPPVFDVDPIVKADAEADQAYTASLSGDASDADAGDALSFTKVDGPPWLSVAGNGDLIGSPATADLGAHFFTVEVADNHGATDQALLQITVAEAVTGPVVLEFWEFNDAANTGTADLLNVGAVATAFDFNTNGEAEADGLGNLVVGDDPGANMVTSGVLQDRYRNATFAGGELSGGVYELEYRVSDWQLTTATGLGLEFAFRDASGDILKAMFNSTNGAADTRIRVVDTGTGGAAGQKSGFGTSGTEGVTIRTTLDLANGQWWTDYKPDSAGSFSSAVATQTLSSDFTGIASLRLFIEGSTLWGTGDFVTIDYLKLTRLP